MWWRNQSQTLFWKIKIEHYCVKSVQIKSFFWSVFSSIWTKYGEIQYLSKFSPNRGKYGPEKTPSLNTFHTVYISKSHSHAQPSFTCSKLTLETLEQGANNIFEVNNKDTRTTPLSLLLTSNILFAPCSSVSNVNFEQVNACWVVSDTGVFL